MSSQFYNDGFNDAKSGLPASPPSHDKTNVFSIEYMSGYEDGCEQLQGSKFK